MIVSAWRIVKAAFAAEAFSGEGSRLYGGRWNSKGTRIAYAAASRSLAALETLVNVERRQLDRKFVFCEASFDERFVMHVEGSDLVADWRKIPPPQALRDLGDRWVAEGQSAVLAVPSVIIPEETNYLINPAHEDFPEVRLGEARPFRFDSRLAE